ncbi:hypothetical protein DFH11DRAFT_1544859 [Phellopilus nigrolimitatus]|nr:hypothetical protein DFH11DRAFT_1544859 [Phellopilus nigrolimitatus]
MSDSSRPTESTSLNDRLNAIYAQMEAALSDSSISSNATADNLPGPGRLLGNLFMFLGRRLEAVASRFAEKRGYGPEASRKRLAMMCHDIFQLPITPIQGTVEFKRSQKEVKRLLKYVKSNYVSNQTLALKTILDLAINDYVRQTLIELNAAKVFGLVALQAEAENYDQLLSPSRKALICLVDVDINELGKRLLELCKQLLTRWLWGHIRLLEGIIHTLRCLLDKAHCSLEVSFLAFRYIGSVSFLVSRINGAGLSWMKIIANALLYVFDHAPSAIEWSVFNRVLLWIYLATDKPTEENRELLRVLASRSMGDEHDLYKEYHRNRRPELYPQESRPTDDRSPALGVDL